FSFQLLDLYDLWKIRQAFNHGIFNRLAHRQGEAHKLTGGEVLIAKEDNFVVEQSLPDIFCLSGGQASAQIDAADLGTQGARYFLYIHSGHAPGITRPEKTN